MSIIVIMMIVLLIICQLKLQNFYAEKYRNEDYYAIYEMEKK